MHKIEYAVAGEGIQYVLPVPTIRHQARIAQNGQVLGHRGYIRADLLGEIADAGFRFGEPHDDIQSRRMGERLEYRHATLMNDFFLPVHSIGSFTNNIFFVNKKKGKG
jgi:hypothetical protein